jgi:hypothetical protein
MVEQDLDVAQVLQQLKQEVREQSRERRLNVALSRADALEAVRAARWVNPHSPIAWPRWPKGLRPKIVALAQKLIRRSLSWYITPLVEAQNRFNAAAATALDVLAQENVELRAELRALKEGHTDPLDVE